MVATMWRRRSAPLPNVYAVEHRLDKPGFMGLPSAEYDIDGQPAACNGEMQLGAEAPAVAPQGVLVRPDVGAVEVPEFPVDPACVVELLAQRGNEPRPPAVPLPARGATVHGLPRPVALGGGRATGRP